MVYLSFYLALEAAVEAETKRSGLKGTQVVEAVVAAEPLLSTLTLKKLTILIRIAIYE